MKKILALITSIAMLAAFTGCSSNNDTAETISESVTTTIAETTVAESAAETDNTTETETEAVDTEITEAETEESAAETESSDDNTDIQAVLDNKADGLWAVDMSHKIAQWENNVNIKMNYEQDGMTMNIGMHTLGNKFNMITEIPGMFSMHIIYDGTNTYLIDEATSSYCVDTTGSYTGESETDAYLISDEAAEGFVEAGIEEINGVSYIYEEYTVDGSTLRYYFDENANVKYVGSEVDGTTLYINFTVDFADEPDETAFALPEGYTEITEEEYAQLLFGALFTE
ncbi:MAG: hypothetical protein IJX24_07460 [Oscillospiraceae bacterium]|nr:hypothetical protein [Oscillospiraceae bacterium]